MKLQPVPPSMVLEALFIPDNLTDSDSDGIEGGTGCNFIFFCGEEASPDFPLPSLPWPPP